MMKTNQIFSLMLCAVLVVMFITFVGGCAKKQETVEPIGLSVTIHQVEDYTKWKAGFDEGASQRTDTGGKKSL